MSFILNFNRGKNQSFWLGRKKKMELNSKWMSHFGYIHADELLNMRLLLTLMKTKFCCFTWMGTVGRCFCRYFIVFHDRPCPFTQSYCFFFALFPYFICCLIVPACVCVCFSFHERLFLLLWSLPYLFWCALRHAYKLIQSFQHCHKNLWKFIEFLYQSIKRRCGKFTSIENSIVMLSLVCFRKIDI